MTFLAQVARQILQQTDVELVNTVIILPNKRATRMLQKQLALEIGRPFFLPAILTINEFIESLSPRKKLTQTELLVKLYNVYRRSGEPKYKDFHSFLSWAEIYLQDIHEIDMQLADASVIFRNLSDVKDMETSFGRDQLTEHQQYYLRFYTSLKDLYRQFNLELERESTGYEGAIYKDVACNIEQYSGKYDFRRYIFAGLSFLTPAETEIIRFYIREWKAELLFDFDKFYEESQSELLQTLKKELPLDELHWIHNDFAGIAKQITETGVSGKIPQILYVIEKINEIRKREGNLDNTVLVLADESLILPFMHFYDCQDANLTMGYPIIHTPAYHLLQSLVALAGNSRRFRDIEKNSELLIYHKDLTALFRNPLLRHCFGTEDHYEQWMRDLTGSNRIFFKIDEIPEISFFKLDFIRDTGVLFLQGLTESFLSFSMLFTEDSPFYEGIQLINEGLRQTGLFLEELNKEEEFDFSTLEYFLQQIIGKISVPLRGNMETGLQVMGLLETRALDFKNVIILSVNEGIIPMGKSQNSLILYDIKKYFNLPTYQQKDKIYAYHFFRLLQRAQNIYLIYNNDSSNTLAEKSRFLSQLEFEVKSRGLTGSIELRSDQISLLPVTGKDESVVIAKDRQVMEKLYDKTYSPTSLSVFIRCPLQFYLAEIEKISPVRTIQENIEQKVTGTILHNILEDICRKLQAQPDSFMDIIDRELKDIDSTIEKSFSDHEDVRGQDQTRGKLFLATQMVKRNLVSYLTLIRDEYREMPFDIVGIEQAFTSILTVGDKQVKLYGKADRIDRRGDQVIILDYKTGKVDPRELKYEEMETVFTESDKSKLFQLLMYGYLYDQTDHHFKRNAESVSCGIISFRTVNKNDGEYTLMPKFPDSQGKLTELITEDILETFGRSLQDLIANILDDSIPFSQTGNRDHCKYCDYTDFCGR